MGSYAKSEVKLDRTCRRHVRRLQEGSQRGRRRWAGLLWVLVKHGRGSRGSIRRTLGFSLKTRGGTINTVEVVENEEKLGNPKCALSPASRADHPFPHLADPWKKKPHTCSPQFPPNEADCDGCGMFAATSKNRQFSVVQGRQQSNWKRSACWGGGPCAVNIVSRSCPHKRQGPLTD